MTEIRTLAVHEIVRRTFPRPPKEGEEVAKATGLAIDATLNELGHQARTGRRPTAAFARSYAERSLDEAIETAGEALPDGDRATILAAIDRVARAYRTSPIFGLPRPKSRVILIEGTVGIYAQPDYWDGGRRIFEMKSYLAIPPPPDVALQLRFFQLAFPGLESVLVCLDRHVDPVPVRTAVVPPPTPTETADALRVAYDLARAHGASKVLEYVEGPFVPYPLPPATGPAGERR